MRIRLRRFLFEGLRGVFRALPLREGQKDLLRQRFFNRFPDIVAAAPRKNSIMGASRRARIAAGARALGHVERRLEALPSPLPVTLVAFYLPQFHPIPENDAWWGTGFTEWANVTRALPQFEGHIQPRLPGDLGFYDLRVTQTLHQQARLAREYGIGAFCFYFYWFGGKTLLESPLEQWLQDASIELPFCLCWANENWSRRWDGRAGDVLISQQHSEADDLAFIAHVARYLKDPRYLRVDGKPLLLVYRPGLLPDPRATTTRWRQWCLDHGLGELCIAYVQGFERPDPASIGFDAAVEFPPNLANPRDLTDQQRLFNPGYSGQVLDWRELASAYQQRVLPDYRLFPGVNCGWDNEPRRSSAGRTYLHASPAAYGHWLRDTIERRLTRAAAPDRLVFINAWNEWAEGAVLEPDARLGYAWLQATRNALVHASGSVVRANLDPSAAKRPCVVIHAWYGNILAEILRALRDSGMAHRLVVTTSPEREKEIRRAIDDSGLSAELVVGDNRGRDILPFLRVAYRLREEGEYLLLKLHTKLSPHLDGGDAWRHELLQALVSPQRTDQVLKAFLEDASLGMVAPEGHVLPVGPYAGANADAMAYLATRMGIAPPDMALDAFISGSMFWTRLDALAPLLDAHLDEWEFEPESGQLDGTTAHALERLFAQVARHAGYRVADAGQVRDEARVASARNYPYARSN